MTEILHVAELAGAPIRFVASATDKPDVPWHVAEDLHAAMGLHRVVRRQLIRGLRHDQRWASEARVATIEARLVTLASHAMAQGLLSASPAGELPSGFADAYHAAAAAAFEAEASALKLTGRQRAARLMEAVTGKPQPDVRVRIDTETGEPVYAATELQRALGLCDDEMARHVAAMEDAGLARLVDPCKLAEVH